MKRWNAVLLVSLLVMPLLILSSCAGKKALESTPSTPAAAGTPEAPPPPVPTPPSPPKESLVLEDIHFDYDKATLRSDALAILARHAKVLLDRPDVTIRIEGHCDERGTVEYNLALGERRAQTTSEYLALYGVPRSRMSTVSYGEERPLDPGHDGSAWAKNRRVAFVIVSGV